MKQYKHFTKEDRDELFILLNKWLNNIEIWSIIGKHPSSVWREVKRNKKMIWIRNNNNPKAKENADNFVYLPDKAHDKYLKRRKKKSKLLHPLKSIDLFKYVFKELKKWTSPELISWRAKLKWIWDISHECIYQYIYSLQWRKIELYRYLPRAHKIRRTKSWRKSKKTIIPNRISIDLRPAEVENREEFGHWEADSIVWVWIWSALNTNRERKSRKMFIEKIDRKTAENTKLATIKRFKSLPLSARKTNTADNWCEFTKHELITEKVIMKFYFADAYSSWQRWTNENWNWLVRRFFPKKTNFNNITKKQIKAVEDWINNRPMKCLWYKTPNEVFEEELIKLKSLPMRN